MKRLTATTWLLLSVLLLLNACSSPTDSGDDGKKDQDPTLTADISYSPQSPEVGTSVTLDASGSTDDQSIGYTVQWSLQSKPTNSSVTIDNADQTTASFTPDVAGDYEISLEISNTSEGVSDDTQVTITSMGSGPKELSGVIDQDSTLTDVFTDPSMPDYLVTGDLEAQAKLTVEPGVVLYFQEDVGLEVRGDGILVAAGESNNKIVFTGESQTVNGFWKGINIFTSSVQNEISNAEISYAGSKEAAIYYKKAALTLGDGTVQLSNDVISHSGGYGIQTRAPGSEFPMSDMTFESNDEGPGYVHVSEMGYFDSGSSFDGGYVSVFGGDTNDDMTISVLNGAKYKILDNVGFANHITIDAGTNFEFIADAGINVKDGATIVAKGTAGNKIVFTGTSQVPGAWKGIFIGSGSVDNIVEYADISYGGSSNIATYFGKANMAIHSGKVTLSHVSFSGSAGYGIETRSPGSTFSVENCSFSDNGGSDMRIHPEQVAFIDNQTDFHDGVVEVYSGDTRESGSDTWSNLNNGVYYFVQDVSIINKVTIEAGAEFEMGTDVTLAVSHSSSGDAVIKAIGTASNPILFTGHSKAKGAWGGIVIQSGSVDNEMDHVKIEYGGGHVLSSSVSAGNLGIDNDGVLSLSNAYIENSANYGIILRDTPNANLSMSNVIYSSNDNTNFYLE